MKTRNTGRKNYTPCKTTGLLPYWDLEGYIQDIKVNDKMKLDYLRFCINKPDSEFYEVFSVVVPHELGFEFEIGDCVRLEGTIRTWSSDDGGRKIELVASKVGRPEREW